MEFQVHDKESAPEKAKGMLESVEKAFKFVPNLIGVMAEAPALAKGYTTLSGIFDETSFNATEKQIVLLTASHENECTYCMAAHSTIAAMQKVPEDVIKALRAGTEIGDAKLEALRQFTLAVVKSRGWPSDDDVSSFLDAGYGKAQILEVILGVGLKTLSNYTNHIADTPVDDAFADAKWSKPS